MADELVYLENIRAQSRLRRSLDDPGDIALVLHILVGGTLRGGTYFFHSKTPEPALALIVLLFPLIIS